MKGLKKSQWENQSQDEKVEGKEENKVAEEEKTHWAYESHSWRFIFVDILCLWKTEANEGIMNIKLRGRAVDVSSTIVNMNMTIYQL